jgi:hypothetical protein
VVARTTDYVFPILVEKRARCAVLVSLVRKPTRRWRRAFVTHITLNLSLGPLRQRRHDV